MGSAISSVINGIEDKAKNEKLANDAINSLIELAKMQQEQFMLTISNTVVNSQLIPISQIVYKESVLKCGVSSSPEAITTTITDSFGAFASGDVIQGITTVISGGLNVLLGSYSGNQSIRDSYVISSGAIGGIYRIDLHLFSYRYTSEQLTSITKDVLLVSIVVSAVDTTRITDNTLRVIVQMTYGALSPEDQQKIYDQLKGAIQKDRGLTTLNLAATEAKMAIQNFKNSDQKTPKPKKGEIVVLSQEAELTFPMGQANEHAGTMEGWLTGSIMSAFHDGDLKEVLVSCVPAARSTSQSVLICNITARFRIHEDEIDDKKRELEEAIKEALNLAQSVDDAMGALDSYKLDGEVKIVRPKSARNKKSEVNGH